MLGSHKTAVTFQLLSIRLPLAFPTKLAVKEAGKGKNMTTTKEVSPGKGLLELYVSLMKTVCETAIDQQKVNI